MRTSRGWSQRTLGVRCGVEYATIGRMERRHGGPSWDTLHRLAAAFGVRIDVFGVTWSPP
jgi:transcriptional regulator with XRE-family HTH domain